MDGNESMDGLEVGWVDDCYSSQTTRAYPRTTESWMGQDETQMSNHHLEQAEDTCPKMPRQTLRYCPPSKGTLYSSLSPFSLTISIQFPSRYYQDEGNDENAQSSLVRYNNPPTIFSYPPSFASLPLSGNSTERRGVWRKCFGEINCCAGRLQSSL